MSEVRIISLAKCLSKHGLSQLISELDEERDRRFKAEQAARKLVEHLKLLEQKGTKTKGAAWIANKPINFFSVRAAAATGDSSC